MDNLYILMMFFVINLKDKFNRNMEEFKGYLIFRVNELKVMID